MDATTIDYSNLSKETLYNKEECLAMIDQQDNMIISKTAPQPDAMEENEGSKISSAEQEEFEDPGHFGEE